MARDASRERSPIPILTGRAWAFGLDVIADLIVPAAHRGAAEPERYLMTPIDPAFPSRVRPGDAVVGGWGFAAGAADDTQVRAFLGARVAAVVACSFDARFAELALALGLPALEVHESLAIHTGERLRIDLEGARVANLSSGDRYPIRNVDDAFLDRLRSRGA